MEDHYQQGGLGDAVVEAVAEQGIRVHKLAVTELPRSGPSKALPDRCGISARHIVRKVRESLAA